MSHLKKVNGRSCRTKCRPMQDFRGSRMLQGEDLSGWCLWGIDGRNMDLSKASGQRVDLRCANLDGANLAGADMRRWNISLASMRNANLRGAKIDFYSRAIGTDFTGADVDGFQLDVNGWFSRGILLPPDCGGLINAYDNNLAAGLLVRSQFPNDPEMDALAWFGTASPFIGGGKMQCWEGVVLYARERISGRIDDLLSMFRAFPKWHLIERWEIAEDIVDGTDGETLRRHRHYGLFRELIERRIRSQRETAKVGQE